MEKTISFPSVVRNQSPSEKFVYCAGVFDLLHYGHIRYLRAAKQLGDVLVVGLLTDDAVGRYKKYRPVLNCLQRWEVLQSVRYVDYIVRQEDTDPTKTLEYLKTHGWIFNVMVRGSDYEGVPQGTEFIETHGGRVVRVPYCSDISSTEIKKKIKEGWNG